MTVDEIKKLKSWSEITHTFYPKQTLYFVGFDFTNNDPRLHRVLVAKTINSFDFFTVPLEGTNIMISPNKPKPIPGNQGFASMSKEKRLEIAKRGGLKRKQLGEEGKAPSFSEIGKIGGKGKGGFRKSK